MATRRLEGETPEFLQVLGLDNDASAREIRGAYARQLKQIEPAAQPEAFQELREAYEFALHWVAEEVQPERLAEPATPEGARQSQHANAQATARAMLEEFKVSMSGQPPRDTEDARLRLRAALDDPRLQDLDARFTFEGGIANLLADGWRPGHQHLFGPAVLCFEWRTDRPRLKAYGHSGTIIDKAIGELEIHQTQPPAQREEQRNVIRDLRRETPPKRGDASYSTEFMRQVVASYPNWLHVVTHTANLTLWQEDGLAASRRSRTEAWQRFRKRAGVVGLCLLVLLVAGVLGWALLSEGEARPQGVGAPPADDAQGRMVQGPQETPPASRGEVAR
ncbi:J domain-containing protein [Variovorax sp. dw_954]|uniref:J domain-containing protein n=1 Tax=Variovorax sp. dw_954 TaxID=2720078 RepID=UPI001BD30816|nr:J domain-containing protein [Variovorax sp. dw_954]